MNLMIVTGMFVCSSFLISVCISSSECYEEEVQPYKPIIYNIYVYCVESFAHIECYSDCSRRESHLVEPLCYGVI